MLHMNHIDALTVPPNLISVPLMTRQRYSEISGIPLGVLLAQCDRGMWPQVNIEALRLAAAAKALEFTL
jgi:hypothetical protein